MPLEHCFKACCPSPNTEKTCSGRWFFIFTTHTQHPTKYSFLFLIRKMYHHQPNAVFCRSTFVDKRSTAIILERRRSFENSFALLTFRTNRCPLVLSFNYRAISDGWAKFGDGLRKDMHGQVSKRRMRTQWSSAVSSSSVTCLRYESIRLDALSTVCETEQLKMSLIRPISSTAIR